MITVINGPLRKGGMAYTVQEGLEAFGTEACFFAMPYTNILTRDRFTKTGSGQTIGKKHVFSAGEEPKTIKLFGQEITVGGGRRPIDVPAPANNSMTTWQIQTSWSPLSARSFEI